MKTGKTARLIHLAVLTLALWPVASARQPGQDKATVKSQARKIHQGVPDIAIWEVQSLGSVGPDPKGENGADLLRVKIKNWTIERTITGVLWEISIYDVDKQKVVEVLTPYTSRDMVSANLSMKVAPGWLVEVPFYINRKVHIDGTHTAQIKVKNYSYRKYDPLGDTKPENIAYFVAEQWPFKTDTEPVAVDEEKR
jgi:hypothetical protein